MKLNKNKTLAGSLVIGVGTSIAAAFAIIQKQKENKKRQKLALYLSDIKKYLHCDIHVRRNKYQISKMAFRDDKATIGTFAVDDIDINKNPIIVCTVKQKRGVSSKYQLLNTKTMQFMDLEINKEKHKLVRYNWIREDDENFTLLCFLENEKGEGDIMEFKNDDNLGNNIIFQK